MKLATKQRYPGPRNKCIFLDIFKMDDNKSWNDQKVLTFDRGDGFDVDEYEEAVTITLNEFSKVMANNVVDGGYGGYLVDGSEHYLVKWVGTPRLVEEDEVA